MNGLWRSINGHDPRELIMDIHDNGACPLRCFVTRNDLKHNIKWFKMHVIMELIATYQLWKSIPHVNESLRLIFEDPWMYTINIIYNDGPNGHLFYVGGDLMMRRGMLPIIMLPDGDLCIVLHLVPFWILTIWGSIHIEETVVGWRNQLRMKTSVT